MCVMRDCFISSISRYKVFKYGKRSVFMPTSGLVLPEETFKQKDEYIRLLSINLIDKIYAGKKED